MVRPLTPQRRAWRRLLARLGAGACAGVAFAAPAAAQAVPAAVTGPPLFVTPSIGLEEAVTDNARLTQDDRRTDLITRIFLGLEAALNSGRATGRLTAQVAYDRYARDATLSGVSVTADGAAALSLVPDALSFNAQGAVIDGRASTFGAPAIDRTGIPNRVQVATYQAGPQLTAKLGDVADLAAAARFAQVLYAAGASSPVGVPLPSDDIVGQLIASLDTGARLAGREYVTSGRFERDQRGFQTASAVQSAYFNLTPRLRLIGRAGYESVRQRAVVDIDAPLFSGGFEYTLNPASKISIEGGRRYDRPSWAAKAGVAVGARVFVSARYAETIQPDQLLLVDAFEDYVEDARTLAAPLIPAQFDPQGNVYQQTSYNKTASISASYTREDQTLRMSVFAINRRFLPSQLHDRTLSADVSYRRDIHADLSLVLQGGYQQTFESPIYGRSRSFELQGQLVRAVNASTDVNVTYAYADSRQFGGAEARVYDSTVLLAVRRRI